MKKYCIPDCEHNIMHHLVRITDDLWRFDQYIKDAKKCGHHEFASMWKKIADMDKKQLELLKKALKKAVNEGKLG
ncbi:MAG: hypothetical protein QXM31_00645 [Candidatus Woesearchaeota archaeon]